MKKLSAVNYASRKRGALFAEEEADKLFKHTIPYHVVGFLANYFKNFDITAFPEIRYNGLKHADYQPDNSILSGMVITETIFRTPSGMFIRAEIPVLIRHGSFLTPSVMKFGSVPQIISASIINEKVNAGTFKMPYKFREMLSPPLDNHVRYWLEELPADEKQMITQRWDMFDGPY